MDLSGFFEFLKGFLTGIVLIIAVCLIWYFSDDLEKKESQIESLQQTVESIQNGQTVAGYE